MLNSRRQSPDCETGHFIDRGGEFCLCILVGAEVGVALCDQATALTGLHALHKNSDFGDLILHSERMACALLVRRHAYTEPLLRRPAPQPKWWTLWHNCRYGKVVWALLRNTTSPGLRPSDARPPAGDAAMGLPSHCLLMSLHDRAAAPDRPPHRPASVLARDRQSRNRQHRGDGAVGRGARRISRAVGHPCLRRASADAGVDR